MASQDSKQGTYQWGECLCLESKQALLQHERWLSCFHQHTQGTDIHDMDQSLTIIIVDIVLTWQACHLIGKVTEQNLGKDFEALLGMLRPEDSVNKEDIRIMKEQVFGPKVFWVTGTRTTDEVLDGGILVSHRMFLSKATPGIM